MTKNKTTVLLIIFSIVAMPLAFTIICLVGEVQIFGINGIIGQWSWIFYLVLPLPITLIIIGVKRKKEQCGYKANFIIGTIIICFILILGVGSADIKKSVDYTDKHVKETEQLLQIDMPDNMKVVTDRRSKQISTFAKITSSNEKVNFENNLSFDVWKDHLSTNIQNSLPLDVEVRIKEFDYFIFYNKTTNEYNAFPSTTGEYESVIVGYNETIGYFMIVEYELEYFLNM